MLSLRWAQDRQFVFNASLYEELRMRADNARTLQDATGCNFALQSEVEPLPSPRQTLRSSMHCAAYLTLLGASYLD